MFAGGEIVPALQVVDAVQAGTVEMGHTAPYYYFGKDPTFCLRLRGAVRPEFAPADCLVSNRAAARELLREFYKDYGIVNFLGGNTGTPDGRLVPQGDQDRRRSQRLEDAHQRPSPAK